MESGLISAAMLHYEPVVGLTWRKYAML